ncbi:MAG: spermidine synthase [Labilithrix sp.]|nr:spermidine synthase [Labilithrix sp.]
MTKERLLLANVLAVASCALVYELLAGTLASYLLGDAVLQFSLVLGVYLFAMGVGAWAARPLEARASVRYVQAELLLALVGGLSVPLLLLAVAAHWPLRPLLFGAVFLVGVLVGLELPLLVRILRNAGAGDPRSQGRFGDVVARALAFDYLGALAASLLFPLVLVPRLGLVRTSVLTGGVNAAVALSATFVVKVERPAVLRALAGLVLVALAVAFVRGEAWTAGATD